MQQHSARAIQPGELIDAQLATDARDPGNRPAERRPHLRSRGGVHRRHQRGDRDPQNPPAVRVEKLAPAHQYARGERQLAADVLVDPGEPGDDVGDEEDEHQRTRDEQHGRIDRGVDELPLQQIDLS